MNFLFWYLTATNKSIFILRGIITQYIKAEYRICTYQSHVISINVLNSTWETPSESEVFRVKMTQQTWWTSVIRDCTVLTTNNTESMINSRPRYFNGYYALLSCLVSNVLRCEASTASVRTNSGTVGSNHTRHSYLFSCCPVWKHPVAQMVEALRYKPGGRGFDSRWCHWNSSLA